MNDLTLLFTDISIVLSKYDAFLQNTAFLDDHTTLLLFLESRGLLNRDNITAILEKGEIEE